MWSYLNVFAIIDDGCQSFLAVSEQVNLFH